MAHFVAAGAVLAGVVPWPLRGAATASVPPLREFTLTTVQIALGLYRPPIVEPRNPAAFYDFW